MSMGDPPSSVWSHPAFKARRAVDLLCREFESQWRSVERVGIEEFIQRVPAEVYAALLPELVASEWELRCMSGGLPVRSDYCFRFPQLEFLWSQLEAGVLDSFVNTTSDVSTHMLKVGDEFCGYKILEVLGQGAMGIVFLAEMPVINHRVALKILASSLIRTPAGTVRFEREARLLSRLDHPGIVPLYSYGESGGIRYLVMKAIAGSSLSKIIAATIADKPAEVPAGIDANSVVSRIQDPNANGRFELIMDLALQLTDALKAVHDADILHRDIKPSNIMLSDSGQVFLTDFSLACVESTSTDLTLTNEFLGTLRYGAPESLDGVYSRQSDLYSLGLVLWELFTLVTPFSAPSRREMLNQKLSGRIPELAKHSASIPRQVLSVIQRMTDYNPASRYQSAEEVLAALRQCENSDRRHAPRRAGIRAAVVLLSAITLGIVTMLLLQGSIDWHSADTIPTAFNRNASQNIVTSRGNLSAAPAKSIEPRSQDALDDSAAARLIADFRSGWLIPERAWELPARLSPDLVSLAENGTSIAVSLGGGDLLHGSMQLAHLVALRSRSLSRIIAISQSTNGQFVMIACQDNGRPYPRGETDGAGNWSADGYFVETCSVSTKEWRRLGGPLFSIARDMPYFLAGVPEDSSAVVLIPDSESPAVWSPHTAGFWQMSWPKVPWVTVAMTFNPKLHASVIQADGKIMAGLFLWRPDDAAQDNAMLEINTGLQNCTSLRFSPSTDHLIAMSDTGVCIAESNSGKIITKDEGPLFATAQLQFSDDGEQLAFFNATEVRLFDLKKGTWIGQPLRDDGILLASPLPKKASILIVERSGAIRLLPVQSATKNPDVTTPSANSGELLQQTVVLTAAAFRDSKGRLLVGTEDGRLVSLLVP